MPEGAGSPVFVFQMAKVASRSWMRLLAGALPDRAIVHFHTMSDQSLRRIDEILAVTGAEQTIAHMSLPRLGRPPPEIAPMVRNGIWTGPPVTILAGVRDPVARAVSVVGFLTNRLGYTRLPVTVRDGGTAENLRALFFTVLRAAQGADHQGDTLVRLLAHALHDYRRWFQEELAPSFGMDVLARPFDHAQHHLRLEVGGNRLFLYRVEDLQSPSAELVLMRYASDFFGCELAAVPPDDTTGEGRYRALYRAFTSLIRLDRADLDWFYDNPAVTAFYTPLEIEGFRARWAAL